MMTRRKSTAFRVDVTRLSPPPVFEERAWGRGYAKGKAKWFAVEKPSTGGIIATSANQIVPPKFHGPTKMLYYIHQTPPFLLQC